LIGIEREIASKSHEVVNQQQMVLIEVASTPTMVTSVSLNEQSIIVYIDIISHSPLAWDWHMVCIKHTHTKTFV
jgi:hypothetical protein